MSISAEQLRHKQWPKPNFPIGCEVQDRTTADDPRGIPDDNGTPLLPKKGYEYSGKTWPRDYMSSCFIPQSRVECIPLPLPPESSAVSKLKCRSNTLYGICGGRENYFFTYQNQKFSVYSLPGRALDFSTDDSETVIILQNGSLCSPDGTVLKKLPAKCSTAVISPMGIGGILEDGHFFLGSHPDKMKFSDFTCRSAFSSPLVLSRERLFGAHHDGTLFCWDGKQLTNLQPVPSFAGRKAYNRVSALFMEENHQILWGGTSEDGILFAYFPDRQKIISYGKPLPGRGITQLSSTGGVLYGTGVSGCNHLFTRNNSNGELRDEGMINVSSPRSWLLYEIGAISADTENHILWIGEADRISHLFRLQLNH